MSAIQPAPKPICQPGESDSTIALGIAMTIALLDLTLIGLAAWILA